MAFSVPPLPYAYDALEPHIDATTMQIHHDKHHQAYVDKLNAAVQGTDLENRELSDMLSDLDSLPQDKQTAVRNQGGGHSNHTFFWELLTPGGSTEPVGELATAINSTFGSFDAFKEQFETAGAGRFGSGWVWLVSDGGTLKIVDTANQDSPLLNGQVAIVGNDVWEHAYYLKYQNRRPEYLKAFWNVVNWDTANKFYQDAK